MVKILNFAKIWRKIWNIQQKHLPLQKKKHGGVHNKRIKQIECFSWLLV